MQVTLSELKELFTPLNQVNAKSVSNEICGSDFETGKHYTIMTVLGWYKGTLIKETEKTLTLVDASWVSETERFSEYVKDDSKVKEEEPFMKETKVIIERTSIIGSFQIPSLTRKLK